jgi:ribose transport system ATP-binding protein
MTTPLSQGDPSLGGGSTDPPLLSMAHVSKTYPGVTALEDVDFQLAAGEVHCLVGENGAGKSTLVKILGGAEPADQGSISVDGERLSVHTPVDALRAGIGVIYQDFKLVPFLSVAENISLGQLPRKGSMPVVDWPALRERSRRLLSLLGEELPPDRRVADLSPAQQQMVEIARVLSHDARIIAMDEPSSTLTDRELANLFRLIRRLTEHNVGIIYISHRLEEIDHVGDRVTVLRDGRKVGTFRAATLDRPTLVHHMVGREIQDEDSLGPATTGETILRVEHLQRAPAVRDVSFDVRRGEILCIAGLVGSGRTEAARSIFAADRRHGGRILLSGEEIDPRTPRQAIDLGIGLLTEDRNQQGLIMELSVRDNILLSGLEALRRHLRIDWKRAAAVAQNFVDSLRIRTPGLHQKVMHLSGGNRQKVVLARWLFADAKLLIFDEPTKGIDVAVKREIHLLLRDLADRGIGVVVISSDLPEVLALGDRIGVMREGRMIGILDRAEATQERVMRLATGTYTQVGSRP